MQPLTRGLVVLAAAVVLWSCSSDPTESFRGGETRILANPSALFLNSGESTFVSVQLVDDQGNTIDSDFEATAGAGLTVTKDAGFLPVPGGNLLTEARFNVLASAPGVTSFTVTASGQSLDIPVRVLPTEITVAFSNATPAANEPVIVTAPGFIFQEGATVIFGGVDTAITLARAEDGSSLTILPVPGSTGTAVIDSVSVAFLPDVRTSLPTTTEIAVAAATPTPGTESTASAPAIPFPAAIGESVSFFEAGVFTAADVTGDGGVGAQYYTFTVPADGDYRFVTNWGGTSDIDAIVCTDASCDLAAGSATFAGSGLDHPEDGTLSLTAGTHFLAVVLFAGSAPTTFSVTITQEQPVVTE